MGPLAYYAPFFLGILLTALNWSAIQQYVPATWSGWFWPLLVALCLAAGVLAQLLMIGAQGVFAQVLPVPRGRSIRGPAAILGGALILAAAILTLIATLLLAEQFATPAIVAAIGAGLSGVAAVAAYAWNIPAALHDFVRAHGE